LSESEPSPASGGPEDPIAALTRLLARLPGIGERTAQRLTFHILRSPPALASDLAAALARVTREVRLCSSCCNLAPLDPCPICGDPRRDDRVICVVESPPDVVAIERTREFRGRYHVLHGALSPLEGVGPDQLKVQELLARLGNGPVEEVILATNPTVEGEATALYLAGLRDPQTPGITRPFRSRERSSGRERRGRRFPPRLEERLRGGRVHGDPEPPPQ
jgi:recombination protein RecR